MTGGNDLVESQAQAQDQTQNQDQDQTQDQGKDAKASVEQLMQAAHIEEEYRIWKKNSPFLYDLVLTKALEWPSLTCQFLPTASSASSASSAASSAASSTTSSTTPGKQEELAYEESELLLGTHAANGEMNYLMFGGVKLPSADAVIDARQYDEEKGELGSYGGKEVKIEIKVRLSHEGEVNRARCKPSDPFVVATRTIKGNINVYDKRKHPSEPPREGYSEPKYVLIGMKGDGYGLDWNPCPSSHDLIAGADDSSVVCAWDLSAAAASAASMTKGKENNTNDVKTETNNKTAIDPTSSRAKTETSRCGLHNWTCPAVEPFFKLEQAHDGAVGDVKWSSHHKHWLASVGHDRRIRLWDVRKPPQSALVQEVEEAHDKDINCLAFSPSDGFKLVTGSGDSSIKVWDLRKFNAPLHVLKSGFGGEVFQVEFSPFNPSVLLSCGSDRRCYIWNLDRIGTEQEAEDDEDGPPELLFVHGGHCSTVTDISWHPNTDWCIASVAEDNILQVWSPAESIYAGEDEDEDEDVEGEGEGEGEGEAEEKCMDTSGEGKKQDENTETTAIPHANGALNSNSHKRGVASITSSTSTNGSSSSTSSSSSLTAKQRKVADDELE